MPVLILDIIVVVLLVATIFYCWLLNKRLGHWRRDEQRLREMIADFDAATRRAEVGIENLRQTGQNIENTLQKRMRDARAVSDELQFMIENLDSLTTHFDQSSSGSSSSQRPSSKISDHLQPNDDINDQSDDHDDQDSRPARGKKKSRASVKSRAEKELLKVLRSGKQ